MGTYNTKKLFVHSRASQRPFSSLALVSSFSQQSVKVRYFQKEILLPNIFQNSNEISALALKMGHIKKIETIYHTYQIVNIYLITNSYLVNVSVFF